MMGISTRLGISSSLRDIERLLRESLLFSEEDVKTVYRLGHSSPTIAASAYVAPSASVIGKVILADHSSVWFGAVLRGDNEIISIGRNSNVQDGAVLHTDPGFPLNVGADVSVGHQAMLHGCTVGSGRLIGIQDVVMNAWGVG